MWFESVLRGPPWNKNYCGYLQAMGSPCNICTVIAQVYNNVKIKHTDIRFLAFWWCFNFCIWWQRSFATAWGHWICNYRHYFTTMWWSIQGDIVHAVFSWTAIEALLYPDRKTFAMWKIARIGRGKHQKAWKQEILLSRREQNSNPLQRNSYVHFHFGEIKLAVFHAIWFSQGQVFQGQSCHIGGRVMFRCSFTMYFVQAASS